MKNKIIAILIIALVAVMTTSCSDKQVPVNEVPAACQTFVKQYFPNQALFYAEKDLSWFSYKYEVVLADGTRVEFDADNVWRKIESPMTGVPVAAIPAPVATYLNTSHPGILVKKIEKESYGYDVELINELELKLNEQGALMEMDD